jgi:predicted dienelactone hydrolase
LKPEQNLQRRWVLQAATGAAAMALMAVRAVQAQVARSFDVMDLDWQDPTRNRPVPVRLYLPLPLTLPLPSAALEPGGAVPLVVFSHGIGGSRRGYSYLGQHFARNGVASLHLQHVGSDRNLWMGNIFGLVGRLQDAAQSSEAIDRALDLSFALDSLLAGPLGPRIDASRIVAAGHSYGANTTLLAAGANVVRNGRAADLRDERVRAAIVISAPPFYGERAPKKVLAGVTVPSLHITATEDVIRIPGYFSGADDRVAVFEATGSQRKWLAVFEGGSHSMFTDRAGTGGVVLNAQVKAATQALTLAFVRSVLGGDAAALAAGPQRHEAILARFSAPA